MTASRTGLLPFEPAVDAGGAEPVALSVADAGGVVDVLSSTTARAVLDSLYREPAPASEVATRVDVSLQNASYHLSRLEQVDLVTVVGTWYSSKGREMKVYGPAMDPLVLVAGSPSDVRTVAEFVDGDGSPPAGAR